MIKGISKNIIEITDTGHECFERVILFVRPQSAHHSQDTLASRARDYLSRLRVRRRLLRGTGRLKMALLTLGGAVAGASGAALVIHFL